MDAKTFLMGSGNPGFSFNVPGDRIVGQIIAEPTMQQQKVFGTNELAFWPSGDPKMQMLVPVQTQFRNYEGIANPDRAQPDTGMRTIYVKGKHFERAAREAVRQAGASFLEVGDWIEVIYDGPDMTSKAGMKPKLYSVRYQRGQAPQAPQGSMTRPAQNFGGNGYPQAQPQQNWQTPGWRPNAPAAQPAYPNQGSPFPQPPAPAAPPHHGQTDQMPDWASWPTATAGPASAPPAPTSAPPAPPNLSTLDAIRAAQTSGTPDYGSIQPAF